MAVIAILLVALVVGVTAKMIWQNARVPAYVGVQDGKFTPLPSSPNAVSSQTDDAARHVEPLPARATQEETKAAIEQTLDEMGKNKLVKSEGPYLHVVFTSAQMSYNDDVVFWIDQDAGFVHYRSQSRVGYSDGGANRARYDSFQRAYLTKKLTPR
ncbi:DUF1499 domain-containing protein [Pseudovibrio sp. Tun.PSC04-5.I4]|uniref:DUF1499 domain-containing protein n=1 Tax=Pseudovibrio sp. Tun.PSC04-5.I4 TaxID=1798213 RepID=UPI000884071B|nr:DUF1499 domain-containing protein [Pseudovibrio sp. Tun.PSC04-5.I4]SDR24091.1 Uncharacterized conserved protein, DUF1499 family [Pseudovibrio sp. Tun.PSC04-5.I4]